jgi:hypothetical protein
MIRMRFSLMGRILAGLAVLVIVLLYVTRQ